MIPYEPRPIRYVGLIHHGDWRIKEYQIVFGNDPFDRARFAVGVERALPGLPVPAVQPERAGVGFVVLHQGNGADYVVLCWWDRENELPIHVFVRDQIGECEWRAAERSESVCVWDLEVIWFERRAYIDHFLSARKQADAKTLRERYLADVMVDHGWP